MRQFHRFLIGAAVTAAALPSFAITTVYTSSTAFLSNVSAGAYTETFTGQANVYNSPQAFSGGAYGYSVSTPTLSQGVYRNGAFLANTFSNETLTFTFNGTLPTAIGGNFFVTDSNDVFLVGVAMTLTLSDGTSTTFTPASTNEYRGFTSTAPITSMVVMHAAALSRFNAVDNITAGTVTAVPEPASNALMGIGIATLVLARRRATRVKAT